LLTAAAALDDHVVKFVFCVGRGIGVKYPDVIEGALAQAEDVYRHKILSFEF
jgi:hypothetical protein